jgi:hypothetical protein
MIACTPHGRIGRPNDIPRRRFFVLSTIRVAHLRAVQASGWLPMNSLSTLTWRLVLQPERYSVGKRWRDPSWRRKGINKWT